MRYKKVGTFYKIYQLKYLRGVYHCFEEACKCWYTLPHGRVHAQNHCGPISWSSQRWELDLDWIRTITNFVGIGYGL